MTTAPCPFAPPRPLGQRPFCSMPAALHSCSFEGPAWEAAAESLCSLRRPLSSSWRQPCPSLFCLINSIINAERGQSFLIATHAREQEPQADRKWGLVPRGAPPSLRGPALANAQLDHLAVPSRDTQTGAMQRESANSLLAENVSGGAQDSCRNSTQRNGDRGGPSNSKSGQGICLAHG